MRSYNASPLLINSSTADISVDTQKIPITKKARMTQSLVDNQQSWAFKSKEPKVTIYRDEEKRI